MLLVRDSLQSYNHTQSEGILKGFHANENNKKDEVAIFISTFKTKSITKDKAECYIIIKGSLQEENICAVNMGAPKYIKQILTETKKEIDNSAIIAGNFNTPLVSMDRSARGKKSIMKL